MKWRACVDVGECNRDGKCIVIAYGDRDNGCKIFMCKLAKARPNHCTPIHNGKCWMNVALLNIQNIYYSTVERDSVLKNLAHTRQNRTQICMHGSEYYDCIFKSLILNDRTISFYIPDQIFQQWCHRKKIAILINFPYWIRWINDIEES